mmetsp:Transcript_15962/g.19862  ORF Transcript_15962/g.19862 Transcript_15962/m.19862 type:complete len:95 (-) Transcript_15962:12-296(-)
MSAISCASNLGSEAACFKPIIPIAKSRSASVTSEVAALPDAELTKSTPTDAAETMVLKIFILCYFRKDNSCGAAAAIRQDRTSLLTSQSCEGQG